MRETKQPQSLVALPPMRVLSKHPPPTGIEIRGYTESDMREFGERIVSAERQRIADGMLRLVQILRLPDAPQYPGDERHTEKRILLAMAEATLSNSLPGDQTQ